MKKLYYSIYFNFFVIVFTLLSFDVLAQGVGINPSGNAPNSSAGLDVDFSNKGVLIPRMTTAQRDAITSPATGLIIFNSDCNSLNLYNGNSWISVVNNSSIAAPGAISGNATPCINASGVTYSITQVTNATGYNWTVPSGFTIASGQGSTSIVVNVGSMGGNICVNASDACGYSSPSCLAISILNTPPAPLASAPGSVTKTSFKLTYFNTFILFISFLLPAFRM